MKKNQLATGISAIYGDLTPSTQEAVQEYQEVTGAEQKKGPGRPTTPGAENYTRMTFCVSKEELAKFRYMCRRTGLTTKVMMEKAMIGQREKFEKKYGVISLEDIKAEQDNL